MREKLLKLMETEHLTASRLAELLGIRSSGISHILAGRNKPSFDMLQKILRRFPNINPDWLLLDSDQMYRNVEDATLTQNTEGYIFGADDNSNFSATENEPKPVENYGEQPRMISQQSSVDLNLIAKNSARGVKRVIVLFEDHTFESYEMK